MNLRKRRLEKSRLYAIIDKEISGANTITAIAEKIKSQPVDIIQLRDKKSKKETILKEARRLQKLLSASKTLFIINDYLEIAKITDADGIHLGQYDSSPGIARKILGRGKIIGISCHNLKQALDAQKEGADYISIGPIFPTPLKPRVKAIGTKYLQELKRKIKIPVFAIGGINEDNIKELLSRGIRRVAVCRADNVANTIRTLREVILDTIRICR